MLENNVSITKIAEKLGFKTINSFSRAFSNYYGIPPTKYKQEQQMKKIGIDLMPDGP